MDRPHHTFGKLALIAAILTSGCQPTQPFFLNEDGDLSHYIDHATDIEFPDEDSDPLPDAALARAPRLDKASNATGIIVPARPPSR